MIALLRLLSVSRVGQNDRDRRKIVPCAHGIALETILCALVAYFLPTDLAMASMTRAAQRSLTSLAWLLTASAMIGVFAVPGCGNSNRKPDMEAKKPLGAGNPDSANVKLENAVRQKLAADSRLREAKITVSADVTRNAVTLTGTVSSDELRRRAVELAREAQAGVLVNDRIQIKAEGSRSEPKQPRSPHT